MHKCLYEANIEFIFNLLQKMCNKGHFAPSLKTIFQVCKFFSNFEYKISNMTMLSVW